MADLQPLRTLRYEPAETMAVWRSRGFLVREDEPAVWVLRQDYTDPAEASRTRTGFFARVRVDEYGPGRIRPHERTHPGPKEDRLKLTRATRTNLSPIFSLFPDADGIAERAIEQIAGGEPFATVGGETLWRSADEDMIAELQMALADAELLIADGHHRYETARVYADEVGGEGPHRYVLMLLCALSDPGLLVFPTHRLLTGLKDDTDKQIAIRDVLRGDFEIEELDDISHLRGLHYSKDLDDAIEAVESGRADAGFFMRATPVEQVREVAATGESMPPKSTYFYPKVPTGLVFNPLA